MPFTDDIKNFATKPGNIGRYGGAALGALLAPAVAHLIASRKGRRLGGLQALLLALGGGTAGYFGGGYVGDKLQAGQKSPSGGATAEDPAVAASRDRLIEEVAPQFSMQAVLERNGLNPLPEMQLGPTKQNAELDAIANAYRAKLAAEAAESANRDKLIEAVAPQFSMKAVFDRHGPGGGLVNAESLAAMKKEVADKLRAGSKQVPGDADASDEQKERVERVQANQPAQAKPGEGSKTPTAAERKAADEKARKQRENYTKISQENDEAREEAERFL